MHAPDDRIVLALADGPWGPVRIAAGPRGVVALALLSSADAFEADLVRRRLGAFVGVADAPDGPARALAIGTRALVEAMLAGEPAPVETLPIDVSDRPAWDRLVLEAVRAIPRGQVASYGEVARRIGRTGAARAVGGAVGRNPVGLLVPCHRVIAGDGSAGRVRRGRVGRAGGGPGPQARPAGAGGCIRRPVAPGGPERVRKPTPPV